MARTPIRTPTQAFEAYVQGHNDLSKAYANRKDPNQTMANWGSHHWKTRGKNNENRFTPHSYRYTEAGRKGTGWRTDAEQKQYDIEQALGAVGNLFGNRGSYYQKYLDDVYGLSKRNIEKSYADAKRDLGFSLLRKGLTGGQADVDLQKRLESTKAEGLASAMRYAQGLQNELRANDAKLQAKLRSAAAAGTLGADAIGNYRSQLSTGSVVPWDTANLDWTIPQKLFGGVPQTRRPWEQEDNTTTYSGSIT
tara:strand:- start:10343 stop:11095 length:753 start_codon:yes stop_codon:yes gene_type:complete